jgi:hypothetical protein
VHGNSLQKYGDLTCVCIMSLGRTRDDVSERALYLLLREYHRPLLQPGLLLACRVAFLGQRSTDGHHSLS